MACPSDWRGRLERRGVTGDQTFDADHSPYLAANPGFWTLDSHLFVVCLLNMWDMSRAYESLYNSVDRWDELVQALQGGNVAHTHTCLRQYMYIQFGILIFNLILWSTDLCIIKERHQSQKKADQINKPIDKSIFFFNYLFKDSHQAWNSEGPLWVFQCRSKHILYFLWQMYRYI